MEDYFINEALKEASKALDLKEVPVGAIIVKDGKIISRAHNLIETLNDPTAHAEVLAIRKASKILKSWRLTGCEIYVTLEPCPMCAGVIVNSRIKKIHIGTFDPNLGACGSVVNIVENPYLNTVSKVDWMYNGECSNIIKEFFKKIRK